jgi:anti-sigma factor RsiW
MSCEWRTQLDQYADGELQQPELSTLEVHLRSCSSCAAEALGRMQMKRSIHNAAAGAFTPSADFRARLQSSISGDHRPVKTWWPALLFSTAAVVVAIVASVLVLQHRTERNALAEIIDLHVSTVASANPVDVVSSDRHTVKPWFTGKLPFTFNLPELGGSEFRLIGGRMAYVEQNPAAQLLFGIRKHQISVFILQESDATARDFPNGSTHRLEFSIESWPAKGLRYIAVSDGSMADVQALTTILRSSQ